MKQLTNYINAVSAHLSTEVDLGEALTKAKPIIEAMTPTKRTVWFHTNIAPLVAQAYKVELVLTRNGSTSFNDKKSGKRADTALSKFRYVTQTKIIGKPTKKAVSAKVDLVEQALELVESLSKAQQAVFFKRVSRK